MTRDELIEKAGQQIVDAYEAYAPVPAVLRSEATNIARALADAGLIHDHGMCLEINQGWVDYRERTKARRREFLNTIAKLTRERVALRAQLEARRDQLESGLGFANEAQLVDTLLGFLRGDQPAEPTPLIPPDDPCQDFRCTRIDGRCVGMRCALCGEPCGAQGHTSCPTAKPTGEADRG